MSNSRSLFLLLLSIALVATWVYHLYDKTIYSQRKTVVYVKDTTAFQQYTHDSLQRIYIATLHDLPAAVDSIRNNPDSLRSPIDSQRFGIYTLSKEVSGLLDKKNISAADLDLARQKISDLQQRAGRFVEPQYDISIEKTKLNDLLQQLNTQFENLQQNIKVLHEKK